MIAQIFNFKWNFRQSCGLSCLSSFICIDGEKRHRWSTLEIDNRELKQPRRRQQKPLKFAYLTMKKSNFARFARAFFIFWHFEDVLVLSTTWNDMFCSCVDDVSIWWQMFTFVFLPLKRLFRFKKTFRKPNDLNNCKMIAETRSYIFRWSSRCRRSRVCLSSLVSSLLAPAVTFSVLVCFSGRERSSLTIFMEEKEHWFLAWLWQQYSVSYILQSSPRLTRKKVRHTTYIL